MATVFQHPAALPPMPAEAHILSQFERGQLSSFIEVAISLLDLAEGDSDEEANGDEADGNSSEDDFMYHGGYGPGCPIADPDRGVDDDPEGGDEGI